jgi:hypothetical protein
MGGTTTKGGLDEAGLDDLLKWADRVQAEPEPEPEVVMEHGGGSGGGSGGSGAGAGAGGGAEGGRSDSGGAGALGEGQLGQPPEGRGSMPAISRLPPKLAPEPGTIDSQGRLLSDLERGIITSAEPAPDQVELPVAIGKSWWTADSKCTRCEMPGCTQTFGKRVRRHHCRKCGKCVCKECSGYKLLLRHPTEKATNKQVSHDRVCGSCYIAFKQFASPTLGAGGVRLSESGGAGAERGSMRSSASGGRASASTLEFRSAEVDWSDVAEETDPQAAARMLRSGRPY